MLNPDTDIVTVYEATVHDRWLRHSLHLLDPVHELFVSEPGLGSDEEPAMTVCTVCGAVNEIAYHQVPSMAGSGHDACTICQRCGSSVTTDPMFGAHVTRNPVATGAGQHALKRERRPSNGRSGPAAAGSAAEPGTGARLNRL